MRRHPALLALPLLLLLAACARPGDEPAGPGGPEDPTDAFERQATAVAEAWRTAFNPEQWNKGFVPLQEPTVLPADPGFTDETKQAFVNGWYRSRVKLSNAKPAEGTIRFPDGTLKVPLISAEEAYQQLDQGDPPPCDQPSAVPPAGDGPSGENPSGTVSSAPVNACAPLTVTRVELGTTTLRTSRGEATVPAWLFTVDELRAPIARVAVASAAVTAVPTAPEPATQLATGLVSAQDLTKAEGTQLGFRLGVGACDHDIKPLVQEFDDVVVIGGSVRSDEGPCTMQLVLHPVEATLEQPLGTRVVLDAGTGQPLTLTPTR